jgi:CRP-like cAMP-binding protein
MENEVISWKAGTTIYKHNDKPDCAYLLKEGGVLIKSESGTLVGFINRDEVFGEQSILLGTTRTVSAIAAKDSSAVKIPKQSLLKEYENSPILIKALLRAACMRLTNLTATIKDDLKSFEDD